MFKKSLVALMSIMTLCASAHAFFDCCEPCDPCCETKCSSIYFSAFGGGGSVGTTRVRQTGTAFFPLIDGGPLDVDARGNLRSASAAIGGANIGYRFQQWGSLTPAVELEGYYLTRFHNRTGDLINLTERLDEHDFVNKFPANTGVFLVNAVFTYDIPCSSFKPYVGGGVGAARTWISNASSFQLNPAEPDINHFNSRRNDASWALAAQAKVGLLYELTSSWSVFAEYRYLYVDTNNYRFGATEYPDHVPTTSWKVRTGSANYNLGVAGIQFTM